VCRLLGISGRLVKDCVTRWWALIDSLWSVDKWALPIKSLMLTLCLYLHVFSSIGLQLVKAVTDKHPEVAAFEKDDFLVIKELVRVFTPLRQVIRLLVCLRSLFFLVKIVY
jgi:hypothetical protein